MPLNSDRTINKNLASYFQGNRDMNYMLRIIVYIDRCILNIYVRLAFGYIEMEGFKADLIVNNSLQVQNPTLSRIDTINISPKLELISEMTSFLWRKYEIKESCYASSFAFY